MIRADAIADDDDDRFGFGRAPQGWAGSVALSADASTGNTETFDLAGAARLTYGAGLFTNYMGFGLEYSEDDGPGTVAEAFAVYDGIYDLGNQFYAFGTARYNYDDFASFTHDAFLGAGPGYRIFNTDDLAWRVQAGPGIRYLEDRGRRRFDGTRRHRVLALLRPPVRDVLPHERHRPDRIGRGGERLQRPRRELPDDRHAVDARLPPTDWTDSPAPGFDEFDNSVGSRARRKLLTAEDGAPAAVPPRSRSSRVAAARMIPQTSESICTSHRR
jgi:hypothetical protein